MSADLDPRVQAFEQRRRARRSSQTGSFAFRVVLEQLASYALFCGTTMVVAPHFEPMYRNWGTILSRMAALAIRFNHRFAAHWGWASCAWVGLTVAILAVDRRHGRAAGQRLLRISSYVVVALLSLLLIASIVIPGYEWTYLE